MLTQLCAVTLIVHARDSKQNMTFASVAVISQHKDQRIVGANKKAHLEADKFRINDPVISKHVVDVSEYLVRDDSGVWLELERWDCRPVKTKQ